MDDTNYCVAHGGRERAAERAAERAHAEDQRDRAQARGDFFFSGTRVADGFRTRTRGPRRSYGDRFFGMTRAELEDDGSDEAKDELVRRAGIR